MAASLALVSAALPLPRALGGEILTNATTTVRLDTTVRYSAGVRLESRDPLQLSDPNADDGNRNFGPGPISNRLDVLSKLDIDTGLVGFEASVVGWYDTLYNRRTDHASPATFNSPSVPVGRVPGGTRELHGRNIELLGAFAHGTFALADRPLSVRLGRSSFLWGESLFFADNGIAAGQTPIDAIKALSVPGIRAAEVYLPVTQAWASLQPTPDLALEAYYQFEWRKTRLPGAGSYFSAADFLDAGGERLIVGPGQFFVRNPDVRAPDSGQFGVSVRWNRDSGDYGLYALRYHAKEPQIFLRLGPFVRRSASPQASIRERASLYGVAPGAFITGPNTTINIDYGLYGNTATGEVGRFELDYPRGIQLYGASFNGYLGDTAVAGEIAVRRRMPLVSQPLIVPVAPIPGVTTVTDYAVGTSLHAQVSAVTVLAQGPLWEGATLAAEIAGNRRLSFSRNPTAIDPTRTRAAVSLRASFEPQYFAVLPGLDLSVPVGFGYALAGRSSVNQAQLARVGDVEIGLRATFRAVWEAGVTFTHFFGPRDRQPYVDRDFISFSLQRTF
ncbi:MAG: DUF1302 family protein [Rhodospirillaceae bacterium]|nr:DUF1302 family protein [Rhodospirillaceae bacterium]